MDRCERTNENGESTFWEGHWLERPIKKIFGRCVCVCVCVSRNGSRVK